MGTQNDHLKGGTRYIELCQLFRQRIEAGRYVSGARLPTELELARELGVNPLTVSRALRELVREGLIVRRRGDGTYVASRSNPPLIAGRQLRFGLLWFRSVLPERLLTFFQGDMTRGALAAWGMGDIDPLWPRSEEGQPTRAVWNCAERGVTVECIGEALSSHQRYPDFEAVRAGRFDGILCLSIIEEPWLQQVLELGVPVVLLDFPNERLADRADLVFVDALPGYRASVQHLAARGLTRIHFVGGYVPAAMPAGPIVFNNPKHEERVDPDSYLRLSAYRQAMDECGLATKESWVHFAWNRHDDMLALAQRFMQLPEQERPQAVVCHNIGQAQMLMEICASHRLQLEAAGASEKLSSGPALGIHIDGKKLGQTAATLLVSRLQQPARPTLRVGVPMRLEKRAAKPADPLMAEVRI